MTGHSLAPLVAQLRERGDAVSIAAADAICGLIVRAEEDARWQVRADQDTLDVFRRRRDD